jgi:hypothetical protein
MTRAKVGDHVRLMYHRSDSRSSSYYFGILLEIDKNCAIIEHRDGVIVEYSNWTSLRIKLKWESFPVETVEAYY